MNAIRPAVQSDVSQILAFIRALALYERDPDAVLATESDLLRDGFGEQPFFECLMAEVDSQPAGFALYFFSYSTWTGRPGLYLEDLFVSPEFRGQGLGKALLARVAAIAIEQNCARFEWSVLDWNQPSIDFYQSLGAVFLDEWRKMRVSGDALVTLARVEMKGVGVATKGVGVATKGVGVATEGVGVATEGIKDRQSPPLAKSVK